MAYRPGRLEVGEIADGFERGVELGVGEFSAKRWFRGDDGIPAFVAGKALEDGIRFPAEEVDHPGVELAAAAVLGDSACMIDAASPFEHLDDVGEIDEARR